MKLRHLRIAAIVVLLVFTWTFLGVSNLALAITSASNATGTTDNNPLVALSTQTQALAKALRNIQAGLQQGQDQTSQLTAAANQVNDLLALQDPVAAKLTEIKANLPQNGSVSQEVLDRQAALVQKVQEGYTVLDQIATGLNQLLARGNVVAADLAPLVAAVNDLAPPPVANITNAMHKLPHRRLQIAPRHLIARPAIKSGLNLPGPQDLAPTKDAAITPEITALAQQLHYDPLKIFLYVRNTTDYQPYYGSVKGSLGAYWEKAGNDVDQASLLIALFRASDIPARYVSGEVQLDLDRLMNWTGAQTPEVAVKILQTHGIPLETVTNRHGDLIGVKFCHTWVEAYIGSRHRHDRDHPGHGQGCAGGQKWVQLDPSFKHYEYTAGIDLKQAMGFDPDAFYADATAGATINQAQSYVTNLNQANIQNDIQTFTNNLLGWANTNMPNATVGDVLGGRKIREIHLHHLVHHKVFPFRTATPQTELSELPDSQRYLARFQMYGFTYDISLPELYGKRFTLDYVPASDYDQQMIDAAGGIYNVFAAFVYMKPQLKLEGQVVAEGLGVTLGSTQICTSSFLRPLGSTWDSNDKYVTTGADYSISLDHQRISADLLKQRVTNFENLVASLPANTVTQEVKEEALHLTGLTYFAETDVMSDATAKISKVTWTRDPSQDFIARDLQVISFFGLILGVQPGGVGMDVKRNIVGPVSTIGKAEDERAWMLAAGACGSANENAVIEQLYGIVSVSTEKLLALANQRGIPVYTINKDNINQILPSLPLASVVKQNIYDAVLNSGWIAVVPQTALQVNQWYGYGWQIVDPDSGAAGYLLAGYLTSGSEITAGGSSTTTVSDTQFCSVGPGVQDGLKQYAISDALLPLYALAAELCTLGALLGSVTVIYIGFAIFFIALILTLIWWFNACLPYLNRRRAYA
jgi:hypothetical protein